MSRTDTPSKLGARMSKPQTAARQSTSQFQRSSSVLKDYSSISTEEKNSTTKRKPYFNPADRINVYENRYWHAANFAAKDLLMREAPVFETGEVAEFKPIEDVERAYEFVMERYLEYVTVLKTMTTSMKRLMHPQKKLLLKRFIEAVACRVCELKSEMVKLSSSNTHNMLGCYTDMGLIPEDIEYHVPASIAQESLTSVQLREQQLSLILNALDSVPDNSLTQLAVAEIPLIGRRRRSNKKLSADTTVSTEKKASKPESSKVKVISSTQEISAGGKKKQASSLFSTVTFTKPRSPPSEVDQFTASLRYKQIINDPDFPRHICVLYRAWLFLLDRNALHSKRERYDAFLYMSSTLDASKAIQSQTKLAVDKVKERSIDRDEEYKKGLEALRQEYPGSSEANFDLWQLRLNLEQWVLELRDLLGKCGPYPDEEAGGCQALFTSKTVEEVEEELEFLDVDEKPKKGNEKAEKKSGKKKKEDEQKKKKAVKEEFQWIMPRSAAIPEMLNALDKYTQYWNTKLEFDNLQQRIDLQLAKETVRTEAEGMIRKMADALIIAELDRLRAVDREKPPKPDKKKKKKDKGSKKRGKKDPLGNKTIEELFAELVVAKIVVRPMQDTLDDYIGAPNLLDTAKRAVYRLATPHDIKMALREMFGLPLCSNLIHSTVELRKSLLLAGPPGVGKTMLVHGLCQEIGANLLDLSPVEVVGKFQGKKQEAYLLSMILKVAKAMEPTIILVDNCHLLFPTKKAKKIPKVTKDKPARWVRLLSRLLKKIVPGDRILVVGVTNDPFKAKNGAMCKLFQNQFLVPFPEYGTRLALWKHCVRSLKLARPHSLDLLILSRMTEGFSGVDIKRVIFSVCTAARQASKRRLRNIELIPAIAAAHPPDGAPSLDDWVTWYLTTPIMAARQDLVNGILESEEAAAAAAAKK